MSILTILIVLVAIGVILWLINAYIPMEPTIKRILNIVVIILTALWLMKGLGLLEALQSATV